MADEVTGAMDLPRESFPNLPKKNEMMTPADAGLIAAVTIGLLCLRRRRCGFPHRGAKARRGDAA